jgi:lipoteichoic acid synthase
MTSFSHPRPLTAGSAGSSTQFTASQGVAARAIAAAARPRGVHWVSVWLAVVLAAVKAMHLGLPAKWSLGVLTEYQRALAIAVHEDLLFVIALGFTGQALLWMTRRSPRLHKALWLGLVGLFAFCAFFGIFSHFVFKFVGAPLTYSLLVISGGPSHVSSSVGHFATPLNLTMAVAAPVMFVGVSVLSPRVFRVRRGGRKLRAMQVVIGALLVAYIAFANQAAARRDWLDRPDRQIALNPHWALIQSFFTSLTSERPSHLSGDVPASYLEDFQTVGERAATPTNAVSRLASLLPPGTPRPKNVITIVIESCPIQHMSLYGSKYKTTPCLDAEAAAGNVLLFDNFYCHQGLTANALVALSLSIFPPTSGWPVTSQVPRIPGTTLAQLLAERGYRSAFISSGDNDYLTQDKFLAHRGFNEVWDAQDLERELGCKKIFSWGVEDRCMVDAMLKWLDREPNHERPFYLMAWTQQTHHPYEMTPGEPVIDFVGNDPAVPEPYDYNQYLNCLHTADHQIGRLLDELRRRKLADETLVIVTGDHGEAFGSPHDSWGHGSHVFEENVHVPLAVWNPRMFRALAPESRHLGQVGTHIDVNPTVLELLGDGARPESWQGRSLFDPEHAGRAYFLSTNGDYLLAVREGTWKYVFNATLSRQTLYDLASDPTEQRDAAGEHRDLCETFRQRLTGWVRHENEHYSSLLRSGR